MIYVKSQREIETMRRAGNIAARARALAGEMVSPGVTTGEIDSAVRGFIKSEGAKPSFLGYNGFPKSVCISINNEVIHGIPGRYKIQEGDIVSIDVGALYMGFHGDCAASFIAGKGLEAAENLVSITRQSFYEGIKFAKAGFRVSDISASIQSYAEYNGCSLVREYTGHGIGAKLHEEPQVPNFGAPGHGPRLVKGMTLAIEPMVNLGEPEIRVLADKWTVVTRDGSLSAHYEETVLITDGEPEILTVAG